MKRPEDSPLADWLFLTVAATILCSDARASSLRAVLPAAAAGEQADRAGALAEDRGFWAAQANATEVELANFELALGRASAHAGAASGLQLATVARGAAPGTGDQSSISGSSANSAPIAAMLDSLYEESKQRIVELNQREEKSKRLFGARKAAHDSRLQAIGAKFRTHRVPLALKANDSALEVHLEDEENYFMKYWQRVRDRNHKQFHTFLKIQHGLMQKLKSMRDMYKQAGSGKARNRQSPEVAFLQGYRAMRAESLTFEKNALARVVAARAELVHWD